MVAICVQSSRCAGEWVSFRLRGLPGLTMGASLHEVGFMRTQNRKLLIALHVAYRLHRIHAHPGTCA